MTGSDRARRGRLVRGWRRAALGAVILAAGCASNGANEQRTLGTRDVLTVLEAERLAAMEGPRRGAELFAALRARYPEDAFLRAREAELWYAAGEAERARALLTAPEAAASPETFLVLGAIAFAEDREDDALASFARARRLAPRDARALAKLVEVEQARGRHAEAMALIDHALAQGEPLPLGLLELRLDAALEARDELATTRAVRHIVANHPARARSLLAQARALIEPEPALARAALAGLADSFEVVGAKLAAREALRNRRRSR